MNFKSFALVLGTVLLLATSARAQNYTITLYDGQNGTGNVIMTYFGPMLNPVQDWTPVTGFVLSPGKMQWTTPPISADVQPGSLNPCSGIFGNGGPNGEAAITCTSAAPGTANGLPLFSFCFQGAKWPIAVGTYNVDSANQQPSCGNYFYATSSLQGYASYAFLNFGSIVVAQAMPEVLYDSNSGSTVAAYSVSPADGTLTPLAGAPFPDGGGQPNYFALHPSKKYLYAANTNQLTISAYSIDGTGVLNSIAAPVPLNPAPNGGGFYVALDPLGRYLYAASVWGWPSNVYAWKIDQTSGALNPVTTGMPATAGSYSDSHAFCVTPDPKGRFVYVCNQDDGNVTSFVVNQSTGALTNPQLTQTGLRPRGISIEPSGRFAYVANYGVNPGICQGTYAHGTGTGCIVRAFAIDQSTGVLTSIGPNDSAPTGTNPTWSTIDPLGRTLYTTNITSNDVSAFSLDPNTGALTPIGTYPAGQGPYFVDVTPSGKSVHVSNVFEGTTFSYSRDVSGALTFTGSTPGTSPNGLVSLQPDGDSDWGLAQVNSGNTFTGNQTVNGTVTATAFVGDGSGLTGIVAQTANTANTANSATTAGTAANATFAASAGDAMTLGGNLPSAFAPASGSPNYVAKGGDTMTGTLNLAANGLIAGNTQLALSGGNVGIGTASPSAPLHVHNGTSTLSSLVDGNMVALFENTAGGATNVWLNTKPANAGGVAEDYYFEVNGVGTGGLRYNVGGEYVALTTDVTPSGVNNEPFVLRGRNVGIGTVSPTSQLDVNGTANFRGLVTFAPGQTFPGSGGGTITGVTAGSGLSGGGTGGNITLSNAGVLSLTAGTGISSTGGQSPTLSLNTSVTDARYAQLGANTFTGTQSMPALTAGTISSSLASFTGSSNATVVTVQNSASGSGIVGLSANGPGIQGTSGGNGTPGVYASATNGPGILSITQSQNQPAGIFRNNASGSGPLLIAQDHNLNSVFSLDTSGSLATTGALTIGSGTPILKHLSIQVNPTFAALKAGTCATANFTLTGAVDGDTIGLGVANARMLGGGILNYFAWVSAADTITLRACNIDPNNPQKTAGSGVIRIDLWRH